MCWKGKAEGRWRRGEGRERPREKLRVEEKGGGEEEKVNIQAVRRRKKSVDNRREET